MKAAGLEIPIFALPSPGVPVLTGMKELMSLKAILNCSNGNGIINNQQTCLRMTKKKHLIADYIKDIFSMEGTNRSNNASSTRPSARQSPTHRVQVKHFSSTRTGTGEQLQGQSHYMEEYEHDLFTLDMYPMDAYVLTGSPSFSSMPCSSYIAEIPIPSPLDERFAQHLGTTSSQFSFLVGSSAGFSRQQKAGIPLRKVTFQTADGRRVEGGVEEYDERSDQRADGRDGQLVRRLPESSGNQGRSTEKGTQDRIRHDPSDGARLERSTPSEGDLAMLRNPHQDMGFQSLRQVGGMRHLRSPPDLHSGSQCAWADVTCGLGSKCPGDAPPPQDGWPRGEQHHRSSSQGDDHHREQGEGGDKEECQSEGQGSPEQGGASGSGQGRLRSRDGELPGGERRAEEGPTSVGLGGDDQIGQADVQSGHHHDEHHDMHDDEGSTFEEAHITSS